MARLLCLKYEDDVDHVTTCWNGGQIIHRDAANRHRFLNFLGREVEQQ